MSATRRCLLFVAAALVMTLVGCFGGGLESALQDRAEELRVQYGLPGLQVACALPDGEVVRVAVGLADSTSGVAMTTEHFLPAGSVGKTGLAAVVLSLVNDGTLDLDAPVSRWLGDEEWFARLPTPAPS